jgi:hypothetical protein
MVGLTAFGGWHPLREIVGSFAVVCVSLMLITQLVRRTIPARLQAPAILIDTLLLFSLAQTDSWLAGFQFAWYVMDAGVIATILLLHGERLGPGRLVAAGTAAFVATFSSADGLLALPLGFVLLALRSPRPNRALAGWLAFSAVTLALFAYGSTAFSEKPTTATVPQAPWDSVVYPFVYLGGPLAAWAGTQASAIAGFAGLGLVVALTLRAFRVRRSAPRAFADSLPWGALALYAVLSAILTGHGRVGLGVGQALSERYTVVASLLWVALAGLAAQWYDALEGGTRNVRAWAAGATLLVAAAAFVYTQAVAPPWAATLAAARRTGLRAVRHLPTASDADLQTLYPDPNYVRLLLPQLESIGQAPFARPAAN